MDEDGRTFILKNKVKFLTRVFFSLINNIMMLENYTSLEWSCLWYDDDDDGEKEIYIISVEMM